MSRIAVAQAAELLSLVVNRPDVASVRTFESWYWSLPDDALINSGSVGQAIDAFAERLEYFEPSPDRPEGTFGADSLASYARGALAQLTMP
jgi:hypothetical protein